VSTIERDVPRPASLRAWRLQTGHCIVCGGKLYCRCPTEQFIRRLGPVGARRTVHGAGTLPLPGSSCPATPFSQI